MVFFATFRTVIPDFSVGHADEDPLVSVDDFQIVDDECIVNRDGAECHQASVFSAHELDADIGDVHGVSPEKVRMKLILAI